MPNEIGVLRMGRGINLKWDEWTPGLETGELTLRDVLATMPRSDEEEVPEIIRRYENPSSPDALPGAISLDRHDCLHVIFGRGMHVDDEAFIIGATMGAASDLTDEDVETFIRVSTEDYPVHWRFSEQNINSFKLGLGFSNEHLPNADIHLVPLETEMWKEKTVAEIRKELGVSKHELRAYFRYSKTLNPDLSASMRLDTSASRDDGRTQFKDLEGKE